MIKKLFLIFTGLFLMIPVLTFAQTASLQTAAELEAILEAGSVTCAQAAKFVLASADGSAGGLSMRAAFDQASEKGWIKNAAPDDAITLGKLSFLIMRAFGMKGGFMYAIFPGPRYAYRSMVSRSHIQGASDPAMKVNGERFLLILGKVLSEQGDGI